MILFFSFKSMSITRLLHLVLQVGWDRSSIVYIVITNSLNISFHGVWFIPALKDSSKRSINSDWKIELPGEFQIAGTTVRYVRRGLWEKISAKGPTKIPLHLMVTLYPLFVFLKWCNIKGLYPSWKLNFDCLPLHQSFLNCCSASLCILLQHCKGWRNPAPYVKVNDALLWENMQRPSKFMSSTGYSCNVLQTTWQVHSRGHCFPGVFFISWTYLLTHEGIFAEMSSQLMPEHVLYLNILLL